MKKFKILLLILPLILLIGCTSTYSSKVFRWGATINPFPTGEHSQASIDQVVKSAKELGLNTVRFETFPENEAMMKEIEAVVESFNKENIDTVLVFQPTNDYSNLSDPYKDGYEKGKIVAQRYPNAKFFQLGNEPASGALKENWPGDTKESYIDSRYQNVYKWLNGASKAIKENSQAKILITGHWLHIGFFEMLNKDGLKYDVVGWDWVGEKPNLSEVGNDKIDLLSRLKGLKKEIWMAESNYKGGSVDGQDAQSNYIKELATYVYNTGAFKGYFVFPLHDELHKQESNEKDFGIISIKKENKKWVIGDYKKAFYTFQEIIKNNK